VFLFNLGLVFFNYRQPKATNTGKMYSLLTIRTLQNSYKLSTERHFCLARNSSNSIQKYSKESSVFSIIHVAKTLMSITVVKKLYYMHSVINTTETFR